MRGKVAKQLRKMAVEVNPWDSRRIYKQYKRLYKAGKMKHLCQ